MQIHELESKEESTKMERITDFRIAESNRAWLCRRDHNVISKVVTPTHRFKDDKDFVELMNDALGG